VIAGMTRHAVTLNLIQGPLTLTSRLLRAEREWMLNQVQHDGYSGKGAA
jgi:hypothetical protein